MADLQVSDKGFDSASAPPSIMSGDFGSSLSSLAQKLEQSGAETTKALAETRPAKIAILDKLSSEKPPAPPEIEKPEAPPTAKPETSAVEKFGSVASALAIFGSLLSRRPLTTALSASAAAMNAIKANDAEAYKRNLETWKTHSEYAGKVAEWQANRYREAMDQYKGNHDALMSQLSVIASLDQDTTMQHTIRTGDLSLIERVIDDRHRMIQDYKRSQIEADRFAMDKEKFFSDPKTQYAIAVRKGDTEAQQKWLTAIQAEAATTASNKWTVVVDPKTNMPYRYNTATSDATKLDGTPFPPGERPEGLNKLAAPARTGPAIAMQKFLQEFPAEHEGRQPTQQEVDKAFGEFRAQTAAEIGFGPTGVVGKNIAAINTAVNHLDTWKKLALEASQGDVQAFNSLWISMQTAILGDPQGVDAALAQHFVGPEIVKAIVASGGGVTERSEMQNLLTTKLSPRQIEGQARTAQEFLAGRLEPIKLQYDKSIGGNDFDEKYLLPRTREVLGKNGGEAKEMTEDEYNAAPKGTHYRVPGDPAVYVKP